MPLRYKAFPSALRTTSRPQCTSLQWPTHMLLLPEQAPPRRSFHATSRLCGDASEIDAATNHYEALQLSPGATASDIKKSFYSLSKTHHPDINRSDPSASKRFMRISEAYSTLSSPEKRTKYDRDVLGLHRVQARTGSYSSTSNPAGGRPASGLSKRRTTFTGPPPSFHRSGGWGQFSAKRRAAHEESTGASGSSSTYTANDGRWATGAGTWGGMGPGQDPFGHQADVPHFDKEAHERTGRNTDARRAARRMHVNGEEINVESERGPAGMFFLIGSVLLISILGPVAMSGLWSDTGSKREKSNWDKKTRG